MFNIENTILVSPYEAFCLSGKILTPDTTKYKQTIAPINLTYLQIQVKVYTVRLVLAAEVRTQLAFE